MSTYNDEADMTDAVLNPKYNNMKNDVFVTGTGLPGKRVYYAPHRWRNYGGNRRWDFKAPLINQPDNGIITEHDFNLTPNTIRSSSIDSNKNLFKNVFNMELYDWYWQKWYQQYDDVALAQENHYKAEMQDEFLKDSDLLNTIKLDLSIAWNELRLKSSKNAWIWFFHKMGNKALKLAFGTLLDASFGPIAGAIGSSMLGFLLPDTYMTKTYAMEKNIADYLSPAITVGFWDQLFDQYLGLPNTKTGFINEYYRPKYHANPTNISIKDFDFYIPTNTIKIKSFFAWTTKGDDYGKIISSANSSYSTINLNDLDLKLGIKFNMSRSEPSAQTALNELRKIPDYIIELDKSDFSNPNDASNLNNGKLITNIISHSGSIYQTIINNLTYKGSLKLGQNNIEVFYNGIDQNFTIPVKVDAY